MAGLLSPLLVKSDARISPWPNYNRHEPVSSRMAATASTQEYCRPILFFLSTKQMRTINAMQASSPLRNWSWSPSKRRIQALINLQKSIYKASPIIVGATVGTAALGARYLLRAWQAFKASPKVPGARRFYPGGFEQVMTRREAALILGVREHAVAGKIREAHRRVMVANHPDAGGSHYLASKVNEAKDMLLKEMRASDSVF